MPEIPSFINGDMLKDIRDHTDWQQLFLVLGLERAQQSKTQDWWAHSPFSEDQTPSFHINNQGWYCHSTHQGGGVIELVQEITKHRSGTEINCYEAGRWLLDQGLSSVSHSPAPVNDLHPKPRSERKKKIAANQETEKPVTENRPIRQSLLPSLDQTHTELVRRGLSPETCQYLGCGYLNKDSQSSLAGRIIFQVRGVEENGNVDLQPTILSHIGRALNTEQIEEDGKWRHYAGFTKTLELYNIDHALLDPRALEQAKKTGYILIVEGCFDIAKLAEAGIFNAVSTFGAHLADTQIPQLELIAEKTDIKQFLFWYDRDKAGFDGHQKAIESVADNPLLQAQTFDWSITFPSNNRGKVQIPDKINDVCEFSVDQLKWLRSKGII